MENENKETTLRKASVSVSKEELDKLIRHHVWASIGIGLVPLPIVDMVGLTAIQLNLVRKIAKVYEVSFLKDKVKTILGSLVGSAIPSATGTAMAASITKSVPVIGSTVGVLTMPAIAGAATYAVGKVFIQHFALGGTFLTFDPDKAEEYFREMFKEGQEVAKEADTITDDVKKSWSEKEKKKDKKSDTKSDTKSKASKKTSNDKKADAESGKKAGTEKK